MPNSPLIWGGSSNLGLLLPANALGFLKTDASGNISINAGGTNSFNVVSKTTTYAASVNDYILASSASFTITLPTAVGIAGNMIGVKHTGTTVTDLYTIATTSSQTIDGGASGSVVLSLLNQEYVFISDGANWKIFNYYAPAVGAIISGNAGQTVTSSTNIPFANVINDTSGGAWNGTQFTSPIKGFYTFIGNVATTGLTAQTLQSYLNGSASYYVDTGGISTNLRNFSGMQFLNFGDVWSLRFDGGSQTLSNVANNHYITISLVK